MSGSVTPLVAACRRSDISAVDQLLIQGKDVNDMDEKGIRPLHAACKSGSLTMVKRLLEAQPEIDAFGRLPLDLIDIGEQGTCLHTACFCDDLDIVRLLLDTGADVKAKTDTGITCIHIAAFQNNIQILNLLQQRGANLQALDNKGNSALHYTLLRKLVEVETIEWCLNAGLDVNHTDKKGVTPFHIAAACCPVATLEALASHGADIHKEDDEGLTAIHNWMKCYDDDKNGTKKHEDDENHEVLDWLITKDLDVNHADKDGTTPFHIAAACCPVATLEALASHGADIHKEDDEGHTALHYWMKRYDDDKNGTKKHEDVKNHEVLDWLIINDLDVNYLSSVDKGCLTPLMLAARESESAVKLLLSYGATLNIVNQEGKTALGLAMERGDTGIIDVLKNHQESRGKEKLEKAYSALLCESEELKKENARLKRESKVSDDTVKQLKQADEDISKKVEDQILEKSRKDVAEISSNLEQTLKMVLSKLEVVEQKVEDGSQQTLGKIESVTEVLQNQNTAIEKTINSKMDEMVQFTKDVHASLAKQGTHNDYVYYQIFNIIARYTGTNSQWKDLARILLKHFPESHLKKTMKKIGTRHANDIDRSFDVLMTWKVFTPGDTSTSTLLEAVGPLHLNIGPEVEQVVQTYNTTIKYKKEGCLTEEEIIYYADGISDYKRLACHLGFTKYQIEHIESDCNFSSPQMAREVLFRWREREAAATDKMKALILLEAFRKCKLDKLAEHLEKKITDEFD